MDGETRRELSRIWARNEAALHRLPDLPAGPVDPAELERRLLSEQDEHEFDLASDWLRREREGRGR